MQIIGIVTEYNPFHNGHLYQIQKIKEMYPDSVIIVAMSGNYTMRGEISVLDKWNKTNIAINNGIDIVLEIPFIYSNQSSDIFSYAALKMLNEFKIEKLVFGSETNNIDLLSLASSVQIDNKKFDSLVKDYMSKGYNYPSSIGKSIYELTGIKIKESNDILGVSYIKEILKNKYNIKPISIKRTNNFKTNTKKSNIISAYEIREFLNKNESIKEYVPNNVTPYIKKVDYEKLFNLIKYKVISEKNSLNKYHLIDEGIENRIYEGVIKCDNYDDLVKYISNKRVTINKVNRILINIFVGLTKEETSNKELSYIKILGLSKNGKKYYSKIKKDTNIKICNKFEKDIMNTELKASYLYSIITNDKSIFNSEIINHTITK
jgi:UPF0348 protein aflv_1846